MSTESLINCEHVSCTYGNAAVLDDVYMQVNRGEFVGVVGPSGSGKTTLLKAILGTHPVAHGSITMQPKLTLGYVPQVETVDWYFPHFFIRRVPQLKELFGMRSDNIVE